ncbi:hypothetical protein V1522DRAFT_423127 [Lipomyces starkeyi]
MEYLSGVSNYLAVSTSPSNTSEYPGLSSAIIFENTFAAFVDAVHTNYSTLLPGGIYFSSPVTLSYRVDGGSKLSSARNGIIFGPMVLNMVNNIRANGTTTAITNYSPFQYPWVSSMGDSSQFIRLLRVRALHYSNGLRVLPLWAAYLLYDFCFALLASLILAGIFAGTNSNWFGLGYLFAVLILYGFPSILLAFVISMIAKSQLAAFALTAAYQCCYFLIYLVAYLSVNTFVTVNKITKHSKYYTM